MGSQLAYFKKMCRKVNKHTVEEEEDWRLGTSKVMRNRLSDAGINNRQAAIRGMPEVSHEDGQKVMIILMALRGLEGKKRLEEWRAGLLKVNPKKLNLQGTVQAWRKAVQKGDRWLEEEQEEDTASEDQVRKGVRDVAAELRQKAKLIDIHCPECEKAHRVANMKLVARTGGFSNVKCGSRWCGHTAPSSEWRCRCRRLWIKCPIHEHAVERITKVSRSDQPAKKHRRELGTNAPMPKKRASAKRCIQTCGKQQVR